MRREEKRRDAMRLIDVINLSNLVNEIYYMY